jgi:hypothetical protein
VYEIVARREPHVKEDPLAIGLLIQFVREFVVVVVVVVVVV